MVADEKKSLNKSDSVFVCVCTVARACVSGRVSLMPTVDVALGAFIPTSASTTRLVTP